MTQNPNRAARFETFEPRLVMSAQALTDFVADFQIDAPPVDIDQQIELVTQSGGGYSTDNSLEAIRQQYNLDGTGQTIAVIDSGIAFDHLAFGEGFGPGQRVVGGYDFAENDANPYDDGPVGLHGSHVAGIIGGSSDAFKGVAPGVDLVSLRVFDDYGYGELEWVEQALQWVHDNRNAFEHSITTVNLSLGTDWNADTIPDAAILEDEFAQLKADGIFISVAAGNLFSNYNTAGVSYPAASPFVIPVASHDADGNLSDFSQRSNDVLVAPGENILSAVPDHVFDGSRYDGYLRASGTSQAAPYVAGASALLREAFHDSGVQHVDQDLLYAQFRETADLIYDQVTGGYYHRINLQRAIESVLANGTDPVDTSPTQGASVVNGVLTVTGTNGNDTIEFHQGAVLDVVLNGRQFQFERTGISEIIVIGGSGSDTISASFTDSVDYAVLQNGRLDVHGPALDFTARSFNTVTLDGGSRANRLIVRDSSGNDVIEADFDSVVATGNGYQNSATGFDQVSLHASAGYDIVRLTGSEGDDRFVADNGRNVLRHGSGRIVATDFESTAVIASAGQDFAQLYDSSGNDYFRLSADGFHVSLGNNDIWGAGFERTNAWSRSGFDTVVMNGSDADDSLIHRPDKTRFQSENYLQSASGFEQVTVWANGGSDSARIHDSAGFDSFRAEGDQSELHSSVQSLYSNGFESVDVSANNGGLDSAILIGTAGGDFVSATASSVRLTNASGIEVVIRSFDRVTVDTLGGFDSSNLAGGAGSDRLRSLDNGIEFESTVQMLRIVHAESHDFSGGGGVDEIVFSDFDSLDLLQALGDRATAFLNAQRIEVSDFDFLEARAKAGATGLYEIEAVDYLYLLDGNWQEI